MFLEDVFYRTLAAIFAPFNAASRIYFLYLITAFGLAFLAYWQVEKSHRAEDIAEGNDVRERVGFFRYIFDPKIWFHPSARQDMKYFLANSLLYYGLIGQFLIGTQSVSDGFYTGLVAIIGAPQSAVISGPASFALYTLISVLALDFAVYLMHYLFHRIPVLWHFHKVHHSAEQLTPMTLFRMHPVDLLLTSFTVMVFQGIAYAGMFYLTASTPEVATVFGINLVTFLFYLFGYNLRHSHIWLNYPVWLSKILVSPAQHQIHHSSDPKHFDRNMGLIFSFWDQLFGTHYIPVERESLTYGLSRSEPNPFKTIGSIYLMPFSMAGETLKQSFANPRRRLFAYTSILTVMIASFVSYNFVAKQKLAAPPSVISTALEDLTWTEIRTAIDKGYTSVIIPTGGTEQNGPFLSLGKHNIIVKYTSQKIAERVGNTLVAPVMAYVPEGQIVPSPTGHMEYAGTISLPDPIFELVLEQTALSLKSHGFKNIFILGESGDSQKAQEHVARRLSEKWRAQGVKVVSLNDYYYHNGQLQYLLDQGYLKADIGHHAGIRDTSEVLALAPEQFRLRKGNIISETKMGLTGRPSSASASIGQKMLSMKIKAGVQQIQKVLAPEKLALSQ